MIPHRKAIGEALRTARIGAGLSQAGASARVGTTQASISNYENGKRDVPLCLFLAASEAYDVSVAELLAEATRRAAAGKRAPARKARS